MLNSILNKIKTLSLYSLEELYAILSVATKARKIQQFNLGIFESRVIFEGLIGRGVRVEKETSSICKISLHSGLKLLVRKQSSDSRVFEQVFLKKEYEDFVSLIKQHLNHDEEIKYIIDAGANVGFATLYLHEHFPKAKVVCIEPESGNLRLLKENLALNCLRNAKITEAGVWKKDANLAINAISTDTREWSFSVREVDFPEENSLLGLSIPTIMRQNNLPFIDILKIDIEGAEKYLFEDEELAKVFLEKTRFIAIEIHEELVEKLETLRILRNNHFSLSESGEYTIGVNTQFLEKA